MKAEICIKHFFLSTMFPALIVQDSGSQMCHSFWNPNSIQVYSEKL